MSAAARVRAPALAWAIVLAWALRPGGIAWAFTTPPPGGALAWGAGGALLADPPGALAVFDDPARIAPVRGGVEIALARARLYELDALTRVRAGAALARGAFAGAVGVESFGPPGFRVARAVVGIARTGPHSTLGAAWSERRVSAAFGLARARSLDLGVLAPVPLARGKLSVLWCARSLFAAGAAAARADADWTAELGLELGAASAHLTRTRDLAGASTGAGIALTAAGFALAAGVAGPPLEWTLGVGIAAGRPGTRNGGRRARAALGRWVHPVLGASDALEGAAAW